MTDNARNANYDPDYFFYGEVPTTGEWSPYPSGRAAHRADRDLATPLMAGRKNKLRGGVETWGESNVFDLMTRLRGLTGFTLRIPKTRLTPIKLTTDLIELKDTKLRALLIRAIKTHERQAQTEPN